MPSQVTTRQRSHKHRLLFLVSCAVIGWAAVAAPSEADAANVSSPDTASLAGSALTSPSAAATTEPNDEIHSSLGDTSDRMWLYWHGPDNTVQYGLTTSYGQTATALPPVIRPKDISTNHWQVQLTGLSPGATYHFAIGSSGLDHTFRTTPTGDFTWVDIGDTGTTYTGGGCTLPWMAEIWQQLANEHPDVVTHGGDITYANSCGLPAVHQFYNDIAPLATQAPIEFAWGNHESAGNDSIANYKGRFNPPHPQTVSIDTTTRVTSPGCPSPSNPAVNGCRGNDWGWWTAGHALFITYPEPWPSAYTSWATVADDLMQQAQNDPDIYMIMTVGHRPAYTNAGVSDVALQPILDALADKYSPTARPDGKYLVNIAHHLHNGQVIAPKHGVLHVVNGGGGYEQTALRKKPETLWLTNHNEHMRATVTGEQLRLDFICGPIFPPNPGQEACTKGAVLYSTTLTGYQGDPLPLAPSLSTTVSDGGVTDAKVGDTLSYQTSVGNSRSGTTATGTALSLALPGNLTLLDAGGATVNGNVLTWNVGGLAGGQTVSKTISAQLTSGNVGGSFTVTAEAQTTDGSCSAFGSVCTASDTNQIISGVPTLEYVTNTGFDANKTGWTGLYNPESKTVRVTVDEHDGTHSLKTIRNTSTAGPAGVVSKPSWMPSTKANANVAASAWVRGQKSGQSQTVVLLVNEVSSAGVLVGSASTSLTFSDLTWHRLDVAYTTAGAGNHLDFIVYSPNLKASAWFLTDTVSLLGPPR